MLTRMEKALLTNALAALDWLARLAHGNSTRSAAHAAEKARATPTSPRQRAPVSPWCHQLPQILKFPNFPKSKIFFKIPRLVSPKRYQPPP
jgi:hypothetical protein